MRLNGDQSLLACEGPLTIDFSPLHLQCAILIKLLPVGSPFPALIIEFNLALQRCRSHSGGRAAKGARHLPREDALSGDLMGVKIGRARDLPGQHFPAVHSTTPAPANHRDIAKHAIAARLVMGAVEFGSDLQLLRRLTAGEARDPCSDVVPNSHMGQTPFSNHTEAEELCCRRATSTIIGRPGPVGLSNKLAILGRPGWIDRSCL